MTIISQNKAKKQERAEFIKKNMERFFENGKVMELRGLGALTGNSNKIASGYFDNSDDFSKCASQLSGRYEGVYFIYNACNPALLARAKNRVKEWVKVTTSDQYIERIHWLLIDIDAERPPKISSTEEEHKYAIKKAIEIKGWFNERGWKEVFCVYADSGNGGHLLFRTDLPNDEQMRSLRVKFLEVLDLYFSDTKAKVDKSVFKASQLCKVYGTKACKGDNVTERPHRTAKILKVGGEKKATVEQIQAIVDLMPQESEAVVEKSGYRQGQEEKFDLDNFIKKHNIHVYSKQPKFGGTLYIVDCVWNPDHKRDARLIQFANGALSGRCKHNSCLKDGGNRWRDFRLHFEPDAYTHSKRTPKKSHKAKNDKVKTKSWGVMAEELQAKDLPEEELTDRIEPLFKRMIEVEGETKAGIKAERLIINSFKIKERPMQRRFMKQFNEIAKAIKKEINDELQDRKREIVTPVIAKHFLKTEKIISRPSKRMNNIGVIYRYNQGYYSVGKHYFVKKIQGKLGDNTSIHTVKEVLKYIETERGDFFQYDQNGNCIIEGIDPQATEFINLKNGMLEWRTLTLHPHDPKYLSFLRIPVTFDEEAECPEVNRFLETTFEPGVIPLIEEIAGYLLLPELENQKFILLHGVGGNGKSKLIQLFEALVGSRNTAHVSLSNLLKNRFATAELLGKLLTCGKEVSGYFGNEETDILKTLTGEDKIRAEVKFQDSFSFSHYSKLIFTSNDLPTFSAKDFGLYRRMLIIQFFNKFVGKNRDQKLGKKITQPREISGFLNRALSGLIRLKLQNGGEFTEPDSVKSALSKYKEKNDNLSFFVSESLEITENEEDFISSMDLYTTYKNFCENMKVGNPCGMNKLKPRLTAIDPGIQFVYGQEINGKRKNGYSHLRYAICREEN